MPERTFHLLEAEDWLKLHTQFSPMSGLSSKIENRRSRFITTLFCYDINLGPQQTSRLVEDFSRKQISWLNLRYITEERLEKATESVINSYNKFFQSIGGQGNTLPQMVQNGMCMSKSLSRVPHSVRWLRRNWVNYHVSDMYIALF